MNPKQDRRLSILLGKQQAGNIDEAERAELIALMRPYEWFPTGSQVLWQRITAA